MILGYAETLCAFVGVFFVTIPIIRALPNILLIYKAQRLRFSSPLAVKAHKHFVNNLRQSVFECGEVYSLMTIAGSFLLFVSAVLQIIISLSSP